MVSNFFHGLSAGNDIKLSPIALLISPWTSRDPVPGGLPVNLKQPVKQRPWLKNAIAKRRKSGFLL
jgi:hypothetical protein